jgi:small subunit ribosomal protein S1
VNGRVTRCTRYGAFVEIAPGIEGLVHISEMSYKKRVIKPEEIVEVGQTVAVVVKEVDPLRKRVSLSIKDAEGDPWIHLEEKYSVGQSLEGTLEKKEHFGYFISLEPGITGLLPKSKIGESAKSSALEKLREGEPVTVVIEAMSPGERRITLGPGDKVHEEDWQHFVKGAEKPVSSLGQKLQEALRSEKDKLNSN